MRLACFNGNFKWLKETKWQNRPPDHPSPPPPFPTVRSVKWLGARCGWRARVENSRTTSPARRKWRRNQAAGDNGQATAAWERGSARKTERNERHRKGTKDLREKAQSRKETSDQLAKEVSQLKAKLLETETEARRAALNSQEQLEQSRLKQEDTLKQQVTHANEATKQAELKVIDANRRIDQLMSDKQELEKVFYRIVTLLHKGSHKFGVTLLVGSGRFTHFNFWKWWRNCLWILYNPQNTLIFETWN